VRYESVSGESGGRTRRFCTFSLAGRLCGVDILEVKEVNTENRFTRVYHAPEEVKGFVNIRGGIHLILDLRRILGFDDGAAADPGRLVLFKPAVGESFGVFVDGIEEVVEVDESCIETGNYLDRDPQGEDRAAEGGVISGVCRLDGALLLVINAGRLLRIVEKNLTQ
jgi:purine-binding chemotaxis protein CheW